MPAENHSPWAACFFTFISSCQFVRVWRSSNSTTYKRFQQIRDSSNVLNTFLSRASSWNNQTDLFFWTQPTAT